jgi:hypothetical protein
MHAIAFFILLFYDLAEERHRAAFEKIQNLAWH